MRKFSDALKKISEISLNPLPAPSLPPRALEILPDIISDDYSMGENIDSKADNGRGNRRATSRFDCLIPGYAVVFFENDVWIGHGAVINVSDNGMLFQFQKSFLKESGLSESATIRATLYLGEPPMGDGIDVEGKIAHRSLGNVSRFGVEFKSPLPAILKSFLQK